MKRFLLVVLGLLLIGCVSTSVPPRVSPTADPWSRVVALERGTEVVVMIDCSDVMACGPIARATLEGDGVEGTAVEVNPASILVRPSIAGAAPIPIARDVVTKLFVVKPNSKQEGMLIGAGIGLGFCAFAGLYEEGIDIVFLGKLMFTAICAGGGAALGYLGDRDPPALVLIYERPGPTASRRSLVARGAG